MAANSLAAATALPAIVLPMLATTTSVHHAPISVEDVGWRCGSTLRSALRPSRSFITCGTRTRLKKGTNHQPTDQPGEKRLAPEPASRRLAQARCTQHMHMTTAASR